MSPSSRRSFVASLVGSAAAIRMRAVAAPVAVGHPAARMPLLALQQAFVDLRFGMFNHFNLATFQDREWGDPHDPPGVFNPSGLDTDQWAAAAKSAGMTWGCLTTKHHDGFCLWPTRTGVASVADTPFRRDIVRAYVDSFRAQGLKVALYLSILDLRNDIRHFNVTRPRST